jgi:hypothetical protein
MFVHTLPISWRYATLARHQCAVKLGEFAQSRMGERT